LQWGDSEEWKGVSYAGCGCDPGVNSERFIKHESKKIRGDPQRMRLQNIFLDKSLNYYI